MRMILLTIAIVCAFVAAGLVFGWEFSVFDDRAWRQHSMGWLAWSVVFFAASCHPAADWFDRKFNWKPGR